MTYFLKNVNAETNSVKKKLYYNKDIINTNLFQKMALSDCIISK